jgi:hypothetical protein
MNPADELDLPAADPLPADVRGRALRRVLTELDAPAPALDTPPSHSRRWLPLLTAAAAVIIAVAVVAALTLRGGADQRTAPAAPPAEPTPTTAPTMEPLPADQLPAATGDPLLDSALARCATAVVRSGRAAEYPPTSQWRADSAFNDTLTYRMVVNGAFACQVTVDHIVVSGTTGTPVGGVQVVRMSPSDLVVLDPERHRFDITGGGRWISGGSASVTSVLLDPGTSVAGLRLAVDGGYTGPIPEPAAALEVTDRTLPTRDAGAPGAAELAACLSHRTWGSAADQALWIPVGRHDTGDGGPGLVMARIGQLAAGMCVPELDGSGPDFAGAALPPPSDQVQVIRYAPGRRTTSLLATVPAGVTGVRMAPQKDPSAGRDCTVLDGVAACTLPIGGSPDHRIVVTAFSVDDPGGHEVYRD